MDLVAWDLSSDGNEMPTERWRVSLSEGGSDPERLFFGLADPLVDDHYIVIPHAEGLIYLRTEDGSEVGAVPTLQPPLSLIQLDDAVVSAGVSVVESFRYVPLVRL